MTETQFIIAYETAIYSALRERCKSRHAREETIGAMSSAWGRCVCGHLSVGNGGTLCAKLKALSDTQMEDEWVREAIALHEALNG